jgi:hypothetical protein
LSGGTYACVCARACTQVEGIKSVLWKVICSMHWEKKGMTDKVGVVLQNCMDLLKIECSSCTEGCPTSSGDKNQVICVKLMTARIEKRRIPCK